MSGDVLEGRDERVEWEDVFGGEWCFFWLFWDSEVSGTGSRQSRMGRRKGCVLWDGLVVEDRVLMFLVFRRRDQGSGGLPLGDGAEA